MVTPTPALAVKLSALPELKIVEVRPLPMAIPFTPEIAIEVVALQVGENTCTVPLPEVIETDDPTASAENVSMSTTALLPVELIARDVPAVRVVFTVPGPTPAMLPTVTFEAPEILNAVDAVKALPLSKEIVPAVEVSLKEMDPTDDVRE